MLTMAPTPFSAATWAKTALASISLGLLGPGSTSRWTQGDVGAADVEALRVLRADVFSVVNEGPDGQWPNVPRSVTLGDSISADGVVDLQPRGDGWRAVAAAVYLECFVAQQAGTWRRLKTCRNQRCAAAFYDQSRNNSGVWHNVRVCGNAANLRRSHERRRLARPHTQPSCVACALTVRRWPPRAVYGHI